MPTFSDAYGDILDYINRPASEMLTQAKREIRNTLLWMQRIHKFQMCERLVRLTYPASQVTVDITEACDGRPRDFLNFQLLGSATSTSGSFLKAKTYNELMQERFKYERSKDPTGNEFRDSTPEDDQTFANHVRSFSDGYVFLSGKNIGLFPTPTVDKYLLINLHVWLAELSADDDTNFLLENCYDFVLLKSLKRFNIYLKDEGRLPITNEEVTDGWVSVTQWDSEVMSVPPSSQ